MQISTKRAKVYARKLFRKITKTGIINRKDQLNDIQNEAIRITRRMICHPDSELVYSPFSRIFYIENSHYYISLSENSVVMTNGKFSYYVWLPSSEINRLHLDFYRILESKKNRMNEKYDKTTLTNLQEIYNSLNDISEKS